MGVLARMSLSLPPISQPPLVTHYLWRKLSVNVLIDLKATLVPQRNIGMSTWKNWEPGSLLRSRAGA